ncbi:MAG TPA: patatin-like phospholipase family protein, partial [Myxococcota bacterium]|nr:patatin-like phospholipase family protein [Myxococcota bacterium]
ASDCLRKRLSEHIEAQESSGAEVEPEVHRIFNRLADGKKGPTFGELRILSKIIPAVKEVAISGSYVAELDGATKRPLPQAKPQLVMFNADTEPDMEIALAVHASAALPPVFKSVDLQLSSGIWVRFQDGGVLNNAPAAETLGVERNLDPLPESGGMTFVFEEEASKEIVKGKAVPRRDRVADWITGAGNSAAEYAKNRALADRPDDVVVVPLSFKAPDGDKKDFSGLLSGTTNFNMDVQDKLTLQSMTDDATTAHIRQRQQPKTREFASMKEMLMSISAADLDALCDQQVEGAPQALAYRVEVEQQVNELRARLKKSGPRELATDPETRVLLDHLEQQAVGKEEKEFLARTFNRFPDLDALLDVMREKDPHPVLGGALVVNDGLRAQAHARTLLQELIYPKMVKTDHKGSAGQMLKLVDDRLRAVRSPAEVNNILDMAATHFRNRPDLFGYFGHKQFAADLEKRRMNLRANL